MGSPGGPFPGPNCNICAGIPRSYDPNDITGPEGYEALRWLSLQNALGYTVRFENSPDFATAPAQKVVIELPLGPHVNPYSFRLGSFGFGDFWYEPPANVAFYTASLTNTIDSLGVRVDVTAGVDVVSNKAFWIFESKDPLTGLAPEDPLIGFLPVNDTLAIDSVVQRGEGFVFFTIEPQETAVTGDTAAAQAAIFFDLNAPILTNTWTNVFDAFPPESQMNALPAFAPGNQVQLSWTAQDDPGGSGVAKYAVYVSKDGLPFYLHQPDIDTAAYLFTGEEGSAYSFYVLATDHVGNEEPPKESGETGIFLGGEGPFLAILSPVAFSEYCVGDEMAIDWLANLIGQVDIELSGDGGDSFYLIATDVDTSAGPFLWTIPDTTAAGPNYLVRITESGGSGLSATSEPFVIHALPIVNLGADTTILAGESLVLDAGNPSGVYQWTTGAISQTITVAETGVYGVTVTDPNGCSAGDSIQVTVITSVPEQEILTAFKAFPNPVRDELALSFFLRKSAEATLAITDMRGNNLHTRRMELGQGSHVVRVDMAGWPAGSYLLALRFGEYEARAVVVKG